MSIETEVGGVCETHQIFHEGLVGVEELLVGLLQRGLGLCQSSNLFRRLGQGGPVGVDQVANVLAHVRTG
jgi:hypothetical protein